MVKKMLTKLRRIMHVQSENFNKEVEKYKKVLNRNHDAKNTIIKLKFLIEGFNSRKDEVEQRSGISLVV